jgi:hypothetical protein
LRRARIIELRHEHLMTSFLGSLFGLLVQSLTLAPSTGGPRGVLHWNGFKKREKSRNQISRIWTGMPALC